MTGFNTSVLLIRGKLWTIDHLFHIMQIQNNSHQVNWIHLNIRKQFAVSKIDYIQNRCSPLNFVRQNKNKKNNLVMAKVGFDCVRRHMLVVDGTKQIDVFGIVTEYSWVYFKIVYWKKKDADTKAINYYWISGCFFTINTIFFLPIWYWIAHHVSRWLISNGSERGQKSWLQNLTLPKVKCEKNKSHMDCKY